MTESSTPAGWYPDPDGSGGQRYWNGAQWTENRLPAAGQAAPEPTPEPTPEPAPEPAPQPTEPSEAATAVISTTGRQAAVDPGAPAPEAPSYAAAPETPSYGAAAGAPVYAGAPPAAGGGSKVPVWAWFAGGGVILIGVIVAAVLLTMNANTEVKHSPSASKTSSSATAGSGTSSSAATTSAQSQRSAGVGQEVTDGNFKFMIDSVETATTIADPQYPDDLKKDAVGEFLIVKMTVTNVGTEPQTFFASFNKLTAQGTEYQPDDEAWVYLGNTVTDVNPGDTIKTAVVFDVPVGTTADSVELHDSPFSNGVVVKL